MATEGAYRGVNYRIGQDKPFPGIRWFLQETVDHFGTKRWVSSPGAFYGPDAEKDAESAVRRMIDKNLVSWGGKLENMTKPKKKRAKKSKTARRGFGALSMKKSEEAPKKSAAKKAAPKKSAAKKAAPKKSAAKKAAPKKSAAKKAAPKKSAAKARRTPLASKARPKTYLAKPHAPAERKGPKPCKKCGLYHTVKEHASHRGGAAEWTPSGSVFSGLYGAAPRRSKKTDVRLALQAINVELAGPVTPARARKLNAERAKLLARARRAK